MSPLFLRSSIFIFCLCTLFLPGSDKVVLAANLNKSQERIETEKAELKKLKNAIFQERQKISTLEKDEKSILQKIQGISRNLKLKKKALKVCDMELALSQKKIQKNEAKLRNITGMAENQKEVLRNRVRALYKEGNFSYLKVIFSSGSFSGLARRITYMNAVAESDKKLFQKILGDKKKEEEIKKELAVNHQKLAALKKDLLEKKKSYLKGKEEKKRFMKRIKKEKTLYQKSIKEKETASQSILNLIQKLEGKEAAKISFGKFEGIDPNLPWPVKGRIISKYGKSVNTKYKTTSFNHGVVIKARFLEPITSVADGNVLYADWLKGYGQLLIIGHGKGYHSLYGHLDRFLSKVGSTVKKGQLIGEVGDTGSMHGPSLYFEIRKNGKPINPVTWLASARK